MDFNLINIPADKVDIYKESEKVQKKQAQISIKTYKKRKK